VPIGTCLCSQSLFALCSHRHLQNMNYCSLQSREPSCFAFYLLRPIGENIHSARQVFVVLWPCGPTQAMGSSFTKFLDHTRRRTTFGRTPLDRLSSRRRILYNTQHSQQTNIHAPGGIRTHNLSRRADEDLRLRPRGHWDRHLHVIPGYYNKRTDLHRRQSASYRT